MTTRRAATKERKLEFTLLGPLEVRGASGPVALGTPQQRALLAMLLLKPNEVVSRDTLIDELWGASPPQSARKLVQVYVSRLRKALGPDGELLVTQPPGYLVRVDPDQVDVQRFEWLVGEGRAALAAGDPVEAAARLREGLGLWRGAPLADFTFEAFAKTEITRLEELRLGALEDRIDADLALGRDELAGEIETLIARHPLRERLRGQLMLALYRSGRQSEALAAFRDARRTLVEEVGVEPSPALRRLERAILAQDPELEAPGASKTPSAREDERIPTPASVADVRDRFVGRRAELDLLDGALDETAAGRGGLVLVAGQAGIGKSRLLDEVAIRARHREMAVLWGRCWEAGGAPAYWPWIQSLKTYIGTGDDEPLRAELGYRRAELATILPELGEPGDEPPGPAPASTDPEAARFRLFEAVCSLLVEAARARPMVLVLDDLHAADEPSLLLLRFVAAQAGGAPLLVIGAYRDVELGPNAPLASIVPELARERSTRRMTLTGLSEAEVASLIEAAGGAPQRSVEAIHRGTEGNPLFVEEVVRLLSSEGRLDQVGGPGGEALPLPPGVREVIGGRLGQLSDECAAVLPLAAVIGREFEFTSLVEAGERSEEEVLDALEEALSAEVVSEVPGAPDRLRFAHALIRDTLYTELAGPRRARLHRTVGEALERRYGEDRGPHLAELAHHYCAAGASGDPVKAVEYARAAADRAVALLAYEEAVRLYAMSLDALGQPAAGTDATRCELLLALGDAQARGGEGPEAKATFIEAAVLAKSAGEPTMLAQAAASYGGRFLWTRALTDDHLVPLLEDGLAALGDGDSILRVQLLSRLAAALRGEPTRRRREQVCEAAIQSARRIGDPATLAYALGAAEAAMAGPDTPERRVAEAGEIVAIAHQIGDRERLFDGHDHRFWAVWELGDPDRRSADLAALTAVAEELRQPAQLWSALSAQAVLALSEGRFAEAEKLMERASNTGERALSWSVVSSRRLQEFMLRRERDQLAGLESELADRVDEFPSPLIHAAVMAFIQARLGHRAEAQAILIETTGHGLADWHVDEEWLASVCLLAEACATIADTGRAGPLYELLLPYATLTAVAIPEVAIGPVGRPLGLLATVLERFGDAEPHFERSLRVNARLGARPGLAHTQIDYARMLAARGHGTDLERARELTRSAVAGYRALGMDAFEAEAAELSSRLAAPTAS